MPEIPDVVPGTNVESAWGNDIRDRTLQRYNDAAARDGANPLPIPGDMAYLDNTGEAQVYTGAAWATLFRADGTDTLTPGHLRITRDNSGMIVMERSTVANSTMGKFQFQILGGGGMELWGGSVDDTTIPAHRVMGWPAGVWIAMPLINNWVDFGSGEQPAQYRKNNDDTVTIRGAIKDGSTTHNGVIATMPPGFRPEYNLNIPAASNDAYGQVKMHAVGNLTFRVGSAANLSFNYTFQQVN